MGEDGRGDFVSNYRVKDIPPVCGGADSFVVLACEYSPDMAMYLMMMTRVKCSDGKTSKVK
jgi:hypothetical protein